MHNTIPGGSAGETVHRAGIATTASKPSYERVSLEGRSRALPRETIVDLFCRQTLRSGTDTALVCAEETFSYLEVDSASDQLAHYLARQGVRAGQAVVVAMTRSARAVVAVLAIWKVGAVYVPVDPMQARDRLEFIIADAQPALVISDVPGISVPSQSSRTLYLSRAFWSVNSNGGQRHCASVDPRAAAYILYTSGSLGRPKGVVVAHESLVNLYYELADSLFTMAMQVAERVRVIHSAPFPFDASLNPLLWMIGGHELHLLSDDTRRDPVEFVAATREAQIGVVEVTATWASQLVGAGLLEARNYPLLLLIGGEAVPAALWTTLQAAADVIAVNLYGPTECTVFTTRCTIADRAAPAIGQPIVNTRMQIVGPDDRLVCAGEAGELLVGGSCVAMGYLGNPALTATKFLADPAGPPGSRRYRTGDVVRHASDGALEFLGRLDQQVKIRGYRVEPGELEHVLRQLVGVRNAAVIVDNSSVEPRLIAFVVFASIGDRVVTMTDLREILRAKLPDYLTPASIIELNAMPLGATGKIDRAELARWQRSSTAAQEQSLGPGNDAERFLVAAWRDLLDLDGLHIGIDDDFFELGGDSLMAARLAARLRAAKISCTLRDILRAPTIRGLAELSNTWPTPISE